MLKNVDKDYPLGGGQLSQAE